MITSEKLNQIVENERKALNLNQQLENAIYGVEFGGKSQYDTFWDTYQENGNRVHYVQAFANKGWVDGTYNPKYPFADGITYAAGMFQNSQMTDTKYPLNFANLRANAGSMFSGANKLKTIKTLTVTENTSMTTWFQNCTELENITFDGIIGQNLDIHWSTLLTAESYHSIITHCSKTANFTLTLPAESTVRSVYDTKYGSGAWDAIVAEYDNVTIAYN